jgi:hypothetical protein
MDTPLSELYGSKYGLSYFADFFINNLNSNLSNLWYGILVAMLGYSARAVFRQLIKTSAY